MVQALEGEKVSHRHAGQPTFLDLPRNDVDTDFPVPIDKDVYNLLKDFGLVQKTTNIVEAWNAFEGKVGQVLGNFLGFVAVLGVLVAH